MIEPNSKCYCADLGEVCLRGEGKYSHKDIQNKLKKAP